MKIINSKNVNNKVKVITLGEYSVGKTSIVHRFLKRTLDTNSTICCSFGVYKHEFIQDNVRHIIHLNLWDTAGQERYRSLINMYFKDIQICLLVYDLTEINTLEQIIDNWIPQIVEHNYYLPLSFYIIGNKTDIYYNHMNFIKFDKINAVLIDKIKNKYKNDSHLTFNFYYVSAKDNVNIEQLLEDICNDSEYYYFKQNFNKTDIVNIKNNNIEKNKNRKLIHILFPCLR